MNEVTIKLSEETATELLHFLVTDMHNMDPEQTPEFLHEACEAIRKGKAKAKAFSYATHREITG